MLKKITTGVMILAIIIAIFNLSRQIIAALQASQRLDRAADELSAAQSQNQKLKEQLAKTQQYDFVEKVARNKLDLARPNETVVVIPPQAIDRLLDSEKPAASVPQVPYWQGWLKLIFHWGTIGLLKYRGVEQW